MAFFGSNKPTGYNWERESDQDVPGLEPLDPVDLLADDQDQQDDKPAAKPRRRRKPDQVDQTDQDQQADAVDVDKRLRSIARRIKTAHKRTVACVLDMGSALAEAQDLLADSGGSFTRWLTDNVSVSRMTCYRFIAAWRWLGSCNGELHARFEVSALTTLAAPSTPEAARQEAFQLAESGETVTAKRARSIIAKHKPAKPSKPKPVSLVLSGGAVVIRSKPGVDVVDLLEQALAEARRTRSAA